MGSKNIGIFVAEAWPTAGVSRHAEEHGAKCEHRCSDFDASGGAVWAPRRVQDGPKRAPRGPQEWKAIGTIEND